LQHANGHTQHGDEGILPFFYFIALFCARWQKSILSWMVSGASEQRAAIIGVLQTRLNIFID
jgi:hypothetical protein